MNRAFHLLSAAALTLMAAVPAFGASFDCRQAHEGIEKIVCADAQLSALDDSLALAYRAVLESTEVSAMLRSNQRTWAVDRRRGCPDGRTEAQACLRKEYAARIAQLGEFQKALRNPQSGAQRYTLDKASEEFGVVLRRLDKCKAADDCSGPAIVEIRRNGQPDLLQSILVPNLALRIEKGEPLVNSNVMYGFGGAINFVDYNMDGKPDIAIQTGSDGPYGQPSYDILLNTGKGFRHSAELTALSGESLNSLEVEENLLVTSSKSGCCEHSRTWYAIVNDKPVPVRRVIADSASDDKYHLTIQERWQGGKWLAC